MGRLSYPWTAASLLRPCQFWVESMSDLRKAAVLLMSLPEEDAGKLLSRLNPKQVEQVSIEIAQIKSITADEQEATILEFAESNPAAVGSEGGGLDLARSLVEKALGKSAGDTINNIRQSIEALPFGFLQNVDRQNILTYIIDEHPQTIALILSHLPPRRRRRSWPDCRPTGNCRSSGGLPTWGKRIPKSSRKSKKASSVACPAS